MDILRLKEYLEDEGVILSFSGKISQEIVTSLCETIEKELTAMQVQAKIIQNIFGILTEQMQNIMSYSRERIEKGDNRFVGFGLTVVGFDSDAEKYYVSSGNFMNVDDEVKVAAKIDKINQMDEAELKDYYRELRKSGRNKHERGAGLGFLEMKKKSSDPLQYEVKPTTDKGAFFSIKVYV